MAAPDDLLSETRACDLLARLFRGRGYKVARNIPFREFGVSFHIDGWDAKARVGFEFLTSEDDDHDDLTLEEYKTLMDAQQRGELALFIIDEVEPMSVEDLTYTVNEFLDEVAEAARGMRRAKAAGRKRATKKAKKQAARPAAASGRAAAKAAKLKPAGKKAAPRKPATPARPGKKVTAKRAAKKPAKKAAKKRAR
ncbi:MAG: hypothetical protein RLZZ440_1154 [Planctomycetota bacterium]